MLTAAQIEARRDAIGASEAAAVLGLSKYSSPFRVWLEKMGYGESFTGNWASRRGQIMEAVLLEWYQERTGFQLQYPDTIYHPNAPHVLAHLDALALTPNGPRVVEAKDVSIRTARHWGEPGTEAIDPDYIPQVLIQMAVTGCPAAHIVVSKGGAEPELYCVMARPALQERMVRRLELWWDTHIVRRVPPEMDGSKRTKHWLSQLYKEPASGLLQANQQLAELVEQRQQVVRELEGVLERKGRIENELRNVIANAEGIEGEFGVVFWRPDKKGRRSLRFYLNKE